MVIRVTWYGLGHHDAGKKERWRSEEAEQREWEQQKLYSVLPGIVKKLELANITGFSVEDIAGIVKQGDERLFDRLTDPQYYTQLFDWGDFTMVDYLLKRGVNPQIVLSGLVKTTYLGNYVISFFDELHARGASPTQQQITEFLDRFFYYSFRDLEEIIRLEQKGFLDVKQYVEDSVRKPSVELCQYVIKSLTAEEVTKRIAEGKGALSGCFARYEYYVHLFHQQLTGEVDALLQKGIDPQIVMSGLLQSIMLHTPWKTEEFMTFFDNLRQSGAFPPEKANFTKLLTLGLKYIQNQEIIIEFAKRGYVDAEQYVLKALNFWGVEEVGRWLMQQKDVAGLFSFIGTCVSDRDCFLRNKEWLLKDLKLEQMQDQDGNNIAHFAVQQKNGGLIAVLRDLGVLRELTNQPNKDGDTPLHWVCAMEESGEMVGLLSSWGDKLLINHAGQRPNCGVGALANWVNSFFSDKSTHNIANQDSVVEVKPAQDINQTNLFGFPAINLAAMYNQVDKVASLLQEGGNPNQIDGLDNSAFDYSARPGSEDLLMVFAKAGYLPSEVGSASAQQVYSEFLAQIDSTSIAGDDVNTCPIVL